LVRKFDLQLFAEVDEDQSGEIDAQELHFCLEKLNMKLDDEAFVEVLNDIDVDRSGSVNFEEFL
jgi:Ca2+-binding EF-hand superfamily protein